MDLIGLANHEDSYVRIRGVHIPLRRGQLAWSEVSLALRWKWSRNKVRALLNYLEKKEQQIEQHKNNVTTIISIVNYETYQGIWTPNDTANDTPNDTAERQQTIHRQECKEGKEQKEKKKPSQHSHVAYTQEFENLWTAYPNRNGKKVGKRAAFDLFQHLHNGDRELVIKAAANYANSSQARDNYAKDPERFLKKDFWRDWMEPEKKDGGKLDLDGDRGHRTPIVYQTKAGWKRRMPDGTETDCEAPQRGASNP